MVRYAKCKEEEFMSQREKVLSLAGREPLSHCEHWRSLR